MQSVTSFGNSQLGILEPPRTPLCKRHILSKPIDTSPTQLNPTAYHPNPKSRTPKHPSPSPTTLARMGIPYSKQINTAFDQVTPLVAAGFELLQTTKNIAVFLACIQILTALLLLSISLLLLALLITVSPELSEERRVIVSPVLKWWACWFMPECEVRSRLGVLGGVVLVGVGLVVGSVGWAYSTDVQGVTVVGEGFEGEENAEVEGEGSKK